MQSPPEPILLEWNQLAPHFLTLSAFLTVTVWPQESGVPWRDQISSWGNQTVDGGLVTALCHLEYKEGRKSERKEGGRGGGRWAGVREEGGRQKGRSTGFDRFTHFILFN